MKLWNIDRQQTINNQKQRWLCTLIDSVTNHPQAMANRRVGKLHRFCFWFIPWKIKFNVIFNVNLITHYKSTFAFYYRNRWSSELRCIENNGSVGCNNVESCSTICRHVNMNQIWVAYLCRLLPVFHRTWNVSGTLQGRHNGRDCVSNHQPHHCLLNHLHNRISKKTS